MSSAGSMLNNSFFSLRSIKPCVVFFPDLNNMSRYYFRQIIFLVDFADANPAACEDLLHADKAAWIFRKQVNSLSYHRFHFSPVNLLTCSPVHPSTRFQ